MKDHVLHTVQDLNTEILRLTGLRDGLVSTFREATILPGGMPPLPACRVQAFGPEEPAVVAITPALAADLGKGRKGPKKTKGTKVAPKLDVIEIANLLPEPFTVDDFMAPSGLKRVKARNLLSYWRKKLWVVSPRWGEYERTNLFGRLKKAVEVTKRIAAEKKALLEGKKSSPKTAPALRQQRPTTKSVLPEKPSSGLRPPSPAPAGEGHAPAAPAERPNTMAKAMKLEIALTERFTSADLKEVLATRYGNEEFMGDGWQSKFIGNLMYWLKTNKLEEVTAGTFVVLDKPWFTKRQD